MRRNEDKKKNFENEGKNNINYVLDNSQIWEENIE